MNLRRLLLTPFLTFLAACGGDSIAAPEVCQQFPGIVVFVGAVESVTPCFTSESAISYAVVSADPDIAEATVQGSRVEIAGRAPGETEITITASNTEGSADLVIAVTVPNRDPEVAGPADAARIGIGWTVEYDLSGLFSDPDGQALTYTAEANPPGVADVAIDDDAYLTIEGVTDGRTDVLVTASDGSAEATVTIPVTVIGLITLYENDFSEDYDRWSPWVRAGGDTGSRIRVHEGVFEVWGTVDTYRGTAVREMSAEGFDVRARLRPGRDSVDVRLGALLDHEIHYQVEIALKTYSNEDFHVLVFNYNTGAFERWASGSFDMGTSDDWIDFRWWWADGQYHISLNGSEFSFGNPETTTPQMDLIAFVADHHWSDNLGEKAYMDEIEVRGFPPDGRIGPVRRRDWQVRR